MTFDPFGDFATRGYLRNVAKAKDAEVVQRLLHNSFLTGIDAALVNLKAHARMLRHVADDGVAAFARRHVLRVDGGLAAAAAAVQRVDLGGRCGRAAPGRAALSRRAKSSAVARCWAHRIAIA